MKKSLLLLFLILNCQFSIVNSQEYPFIRYEANKVQYDTASESMQAFFAKWQRVNQTGQGTINIVHIGGSHVQAGTFPHRVRSRMLTDNPALVGGRGMVFPYSAAAKCNNPPDYKVHCAEPVQLTRNVYKTIDHPLGLCGIAVTAHDTPTRIQIINNESRFNYASSHITVLGYSPEGVIPRLSYDGREVQPSYIDSASRRFVFNLRQEVDSFDIVLPCLEGETFTLTGVSLGNRRPGISYHSIGVNGAAVPDYLKCDYLTTDLRLVHPDLVVFGIGINDAAGPNFDTLVFKENYLRLCDSIRQANPRCAFIFITNNDSYRRVGRRKYAVNHNGLLVREVCYRLAAATGGAVWDQFEIMGGLKSMEKWQKAGLAQRDKVHFTRAGYLLMGDLFYEAFCRMIKEAKVSTPAQAAPAQPQQVNPKALYRKPSAPAIAKPDTTPKQQSADSTKPAAQAKPAKRTRPKHATIQPPEPKEDNTPFSIDDDRSPYISH